MTIEHGPFCLSRWFAGQCDCQPQLAQSAAGSNASPAPAFQPPPNATASGGCAYCGARLSGPICPKCGMSVTPPSQDAKGRNIVDALGKEQP